MKAEVVIEIRGGTVVGLYANHMDLTAQVVDWDDIAENPGHFPVRVKASALAEMPRETAMIARPGLRS